METNKIIPTIAYFDMFDYPLTETELNKWQFSDKVLDGLKFDQNNLVESTGGFYHLSGRGELVKKRHQRYLIADKKYKRALKFAKIFRLLPSIKMIAICNTLAISNARDESDIDFFIITTRNKLWLTRFWLQSFLALLGIRPYDHGTSIKDALCLSFFITEDNLNFDSIRLNKRDVHFALWLTQMVPIYDSENIYDKFWQANLWVKEVLPEIYPKQVVPERLIKPIVINKLFNFFTLDFWEKYTRRWQELIFPAKIKQMANQDRRVIVNDKMLKFHTNDPLQKLYDQWLEKLQTLK